jgi:hypothetical protein
MSGYEFQELLKTAFEELSVAENTPIVQVQFTYNNNTLQVIPLPVNGSSITNASGHAVLSTAASADNDAQLFTRKLIRYNNGQGNVIKFTGIFTTGVANSEQFIGIGNCCDALGFGYNGANFGVLRRRGGSSEVRTLTITTASSTNENITITLDGDAETTVAVTNSGDTTTTAREIADHIYLSTSTYGWVATAHGDKVTFLSLDSGAHSGTFSLSSATTAVGTFAQDIAGVAATDSWIAQSSWSEDVMDGSGPSGMTLDPTKGNVYKVVYQWLGYGPIRYYIQDDGTGEFQLVHEIVYANQFTETTISNPSIPLFMQAKNTSNTTAITVKSPSIAGFVQGKDEKKGVPFSATSGAQTLSSTTETPIITLRNKVIYQGQLNRVEALPQIITVSFNPTAASNDTLIRVYQDATAEGGASYTDIDSDNSVSEFDISATSFSNGNLIYETSISGSSPIPAIIDLEALDISQIPTSTIMVTREHTAASSAVEIATINFKELV